MALLSIALKDRDGRPDDELMDALTDYPLLRIDPNGWMQLSKDGQAFWVEVRGGMT